MFREVARSRQALNREECLRILKEEKRGVLAVLTDDGYPYALPIDHYYCEEDGHIYFHSGKTGHKIDAVRGHDKVSYCVYGSGEREEGEWWLCFKSVIVFGRIREVEDPEKIIDISRKLSLKFTDDLEYIEKEVRQSGPRTALLELVPEHMTGKRVTER
ncbi:MAG: pyridoxamine 5'-phosphate oxidase family protein [Clostridia bacterium]|nr:pyridoxamine 5'-phosphate oxidase family protein [Clostridia bacterium]